MGQVTPEIEAIEKKYDVSFFGRTGFSPRPPFERLSEKIEPFGQVIRHVGTRHRHVKSVPVNEFIRYPRVVIFALEAVEYILGSLTMNGETRWFIIRQKVLSQDIKTFVDDGTIPS